MRKNFLLYAAIGALALIGATIYATGYAKAADKGGIVTRAEAEQMFPTNPWTALYGSVGVGTGALTSDAMPIGIEGTAFSARIGGDVQISRILFGVFTNYQWDTVSVFGSSTHPTEWLIAARAGVLVTDSTLVYGLVGSNKLSVSGMDTRGVTVGGGIETALTKHWRLALEYDRTTYSDLPTFQEQVVTARLIFAIPVNSSLFGGR